MATEGFSGKDGTVEADGSELGDVIKWTADITVAISKYNSNLTKGHKYPIAGVADSKGTIEVKVGSTVGLELAPGQQVDLELHVDDSGSNYLEFIDAVIAGSPLECDIDNGEVVSTTYAFEGASVKGYGICAAIDLGDTAVAE